MKVSKVSLQFNGTLLDQHAELTLDELGRVSAVQVDFIIDLVHEGVITPTVSGAPEHWRFQGDQVRYVAVAARLQRDLGVNLAGVALALQLLDELATLRAQVLQ